MRVRVFLQGVLFGLKDVLKENTTFGGWRWPCGRRRIGVGEVLVIDIFRRLTDLRRAEVALDTVVGSPQFGTS
jgi:hypothetical protein